MPGRRRARVESLASHPHLPLDRESADKVWAGFQAAGALPLPGLPHAAEAAE